MDVAVDHQLAVVLEVPLGLEVVDLLEEDLGVEDHAVADDAAFPLVENPRGDQVEHRLLVADHQGMAGIVAALVAHHVLGILGVDVDDLALAFIAPLGAYDNHIGHVEFRLLSWLQRKVLGQQSGRGQALPTAVGQPDEFRVRAGFAEDQNVTVVHLRRIGETRLEVAGNDVASR